MISDVLPSQTWPSGAGLHLWEESWLRKQGVRVSRILLLNEAERTVTWGQRVDYILLHSSRSWFQGCQKWFLVCERGLWPFIHEDSRVILWQAQETETELWKSPPAPSARHPLSPPGSTPWPVSPPAPSARHPLSPPGSTPWPVSDGVIVIPVIFILALIFTE